MKKYLLMMVGVLACAVALAQTSTQNSVLRQNHNTDKRGYNRLSVSYNSFGFDDDVFSDDLKNMDGVSLFWVKGLPISSSAPFYVETGIGLTYAWASEKATGSMLYENESYGLRAKCENKFMSMTVPLNIVCRLNIPNTGVAISPFVGVYLRGNLYGNSKIKVAASNDTYSEKAEQDIGWFDGIDEDEPGFDASRISVGWNIGVGVEGKHVYMGISYGDDFNSFIDIDDAKTTISTFAVTAGYKF